VAGRVVLGVNTALKPSGHDQERGADGHTADATTIRKYKTVAALDLAPAWGHGSFGRPCRYCMDVRFGYPRRVRPTRSGTARRQPAHSGTVELIRREMAKA